MTGTAYARAALAGNPSDGYGGGVLAVCLGNSSVSVELHERPGAATLEVEPSAASGLVRAAAARHAAATGRDAPALRATVRTAIPREVGLAGSSAIVIATLRALDALLGTRVSVARLPTLALAAETDLGIAAGLQDRVAQAHGGLTAMTFALDGSYAARALDPLRLPPLALAWDTRGAAPSGAYHSDLRARWAAGEPLVRSVMAALRRVAAEAAAAVIDGDADALGRAMDRSFDLRAALGPLPPRHVALVDAARRYGLPVNFTGSGGSVIAVCPADDVLGALGDELRGAGGEAARVRLPP